ncbi:MAG: DUF1971 domain-containing protein [Cellvibrionales bacterium]|nr:DUF1971 domain-containing protein [Cellvibrionales bacterium]
MKNLPKHVQAYKKTPEFSEDSIPKSLLKDHSTKPGVWGKIQLIEGSLIYVINQQEHHVLTQNSEGIIEPEISHHLKCKGPVRFFVEFYR